MKATEKDEKKALKKYIEKTFVDMLTWYPESLHYSIAYDKRETNSSGGIMELEIDFNNMVMNLFVYKATFKNSRVRIFSILAHEVGHIFLQHLNILSSNRYVSEEEYSLTLEQSATRVGWLIEKLVEGYKKPNKPKKKKKGEKKEV